MDTSTGVMAKAVLLAIGARDSEADAILVKLAHRAVPQTPQAVLVELSAALSRHRRGLQ